MLFSLFVASALGARKDGYEYKKRLSTAGMKKGQCATLLSDEAYFDTPQHPNAQLPVEACDRANRIDGEGPGACGAIQYVHGEGWKLCRGTEVNENVSSGRVIPVTLVPYYETALERHVCKFREADGPMNCYDCLALGPQCYWEGNKPEVYGVDKWGQQLWRKSSLKTEVCDYSYFYGSRGTQSTMPGVFSSSVPNMIQPGRTTFANDCPESHCDSAEILSKCSMCGVCEEADCESYARTSDAPPICGYPICEFVCGKDKICDICTGTGKSTGYFDVVTRSVNARAVPLEDQLEDQLEDILAEANFDSAKNSGDEHGRLLRAISALSKGRAHARGVNGYSGTRPSWEVLSSTDCESNGEDLSFPEWVPSAYTPSGGVAECKLKCEADMKCVGFTWDPSNAACFWVKHEEWYMADILGEPSYSEYINPYLEPDARGHDCHYMTKKLRFENGQTCETDAMCKSMNCQIDHSKFNPIYSQGPGAFGEAFQSGKTMTDPSAEAVSCQP